MNASNSSPSTSLLPILLLKNYLHFLSRRPISGSNLHFKAGRIASLQTLVPLLTSNLGDDLEECVAMLRTLSTTNLARFAPQILRLLQRHKEPPLPRHIVSSTTQPPACFFAGVQRALLVLGQGIGIGDEIITFPLAATLRSRISADATLAVLSSYRDLWRDVPGVDSQGLYDGLGEVVEAIRDGGYDLVVVVDFERPGLLSTLCEEPAIVRYIELAMGLRELSVLDKPEGRMWKLEHPDPYDANFYHHMERMRLWLGDQQQPAKLLPGAFGSEGSREVVIYASPFTSKEDPSQQFWFELLLSMLQEELSVGVSVSIHVDSGANYATRAFALELARSIDNSGRPGISAKAASTIGIAGSLLSLADAMQRIANSDIIVTSDSFPAHAGQLYGKLTLVLARDGVENWRAPAPGNFYLRAGAPTTELVAQARVLLGDLAHLHPVAGSIAGSPALSALRSSARLLHRTLHQNGAQLDGEALRLQWTHAHEATLAVLAESAEWPSGYSVLFADNEYHGLLPPHPPADMDSPASLLHMRCRVAEWCNSNLLKYALWPGLEGASS